MSLYKYSIHVIAYMHTHYTYRTYILQSVFMKISATTKSVVHMSVHEVQWVHSEVGVAPEERCGTWVLQQEFP